MLFVPNRLKTYPILVILEDSYEDEESDFFVSKYFLFSTGFSLGRVS
jgi:hypothetical protein